MEGGKFDIPDIPDIPELDDEDDNPSGGGGGGGGRRRGLGGRGRGGPGGGGNSPSPYGGGGGRPTKPRRWLWFLIGIAVGVAGTLYVPDLASPYLPDFLRPDRQEVHGLVLQKSLEPDRLLLTVESPRGSMLATFRDEVSELDLLISEGDSITLALGDYRPFVNDPSVRGVRRNPGSAATGARADTPAARPGSGPADTTAGGAAAGSPPAQPDTGRAGGGG